MGRVQGFLTVKAISAETATYIFSTLLLFFTSNQSESSLNSRTDRQEEAAYAYRLIRRVFFLGLARYLFTYLEIFNFT